MKNNELTFIDLFAGIGGIRKGFESSRTKCVFSSEWDKYAQKTYQANYGDLPYGDITQINAKDIPNHDILLAGFPCQPFSTIGKRQGFEHATQGTLFFDVLRILKYHMPKMFLLENVQGLLTIQNGETFKIILNCLSEAGYDVYHELMNAKDFGLPQTRKRVIIVGFRKDLNIKDFEFPKSAGKTTYINEILEDNPSGYSISKHLQQSYLFKKDDGRPQIVDKSSEIQIKTFCASYHKIQRLTGTFVKGGETGLRLLSELECKRLMGFPDDFKFPVSRTQMYRQIGNSVCVPMIRAVAKKMLQAFDNACN
ncbi:DNA cytosine methyltransferase [Holdemanella biformis]|uniref:DNA cytosine methyltransferase n=1 Tax=Holdemanella biformis TaxID=1735 RepID=UPI0022DEC15B|nr:DNA cytosine methyltransferase [Holdemanella biformis]